MNEEMIKETEDSINLCLGDSQWVNADGRRILEEDFSVDGEIWRVNKYDADPFPSNPHAHYIEGTRRFVGCKLHLGAAELYRGREHLGDISITNSLSVSLTSSAQNSRIWSFLSQIGTLPIIR